MEKVAIYGGSFDPPHKGHGEIIRRLTDEFDRVIVVPGFISPFKQEQKQASAADRLCMLRLAVQDAFLGDSTSAQQQVLTTNTADKNTTKTASANNQASLQSNTALQNKVEISTYEIDKGGVSYTFDTITHLASVMPKAKLFFVTGSESLPTLHKWRNADKLKKMVTFYIVPRENYTLKLRKDFDMQSAPWIVPDYSSSWFKAARAFDCSRPLVGDKVYDYIIARGLYDDYMRFTKDFDAFNLEKERILHIYGAVKAGITLAKIHGESVDSAITALILHDMGKRSSPQLLQQLGINPTPTDDIPQAVRHAVWGVDIARQRYNITDEDILNAIRYHTTGRPNMSRLEKIVTLADYAEEGRRFAGREHIFNAAMVDLDTAMVKMLQSVARYLQEKKREIFDISQKALFFYQDLIYTKK